MIPEIYLCLGWGSEINGEVVRARGELMMALSWFSSLSFLVVRFFLLALSLSRLFFFARGE